MWLWPPLGRHAQTPAGNLRELGVNEDELRADDLVELQVARRGLHEALDFVTELDLPRRLAPFSFAFSVRTIPLYDLLDP